MDKEVNVAHVIVNNLGGITSLTKNLIIYTDDNALPQELHLLNIVGSNNTPAFIDDNIMNKVIPFQLYPKDNWYHVYKSLSNNLNKSNGVLISNDQYDLIMLRAFNIDRKIIQIVHDEYNLNLSLQFDDCIDYFIAHSKYIYEQLSIKIPHRLNDIQLIHYGIPIKENVSRNKNIDQNLKLLFLGRHVKDKGIFDIFEINKLLKKKNINVTWTILGKGPETVNVIKQWENESNVTFLTPDTQSEVLDIIEKNDILVFPTKFEGFPVAILESMSAGCIPIASDIVGGVQEVVIDNLTGFKCEMDNNLAFATKIEMLHLNRDILYSMQQNAIKLTLDHFDINNQCKLYQQFFRKISENVKRPKHHAVNKKIGSRLDNKLLPNFITRYLRKASKIIS